MNTLCIFARLLGRFSSVVFNCLKFSISQKWLITILISQNTKWQKLQKNVKDSTLMYKCLIFQLVNIFSMWFDYCCGECLAANFTLVIFATFMNINRALGGNLKVGGPTLVKFLGENDLSPELHLWSFFLRCTAWLCVLSFPPSEKDLPHESHLWSLCPSWTMWMCFFKYPD